MTYYPRLNNIFITEGLRRKLDEIKNHPITTIIAPMGFGKTTAINWWSKRQVKKQANIVILRQIIATDSITDFWSGLCGAFKGYPALVEQLKALGYPKDGRSISIFAEILDDVLSKNPNPIYYIIEDIYILQQKQLAPLLLFLSRAMPETVHIILISRNQIFRGEEKMQLGNLLCEITVSDLRLKDEEIGIYAKHCEIKASSDEIRDLAKSSEGWISMVYLNFKHYIQNETWLSNSEDIFTLIDQVLLSPLSENNREFLILLGMTEEFTKEQAIYLWNNPDTVDLLESLTKNNAFINKNENGIYRYHHMLRQCTRQKFSEKSEEYQRDNYSRLGHWYLSVEEYIPAYYAFYKAKDWDALFITVERDRFNSFNTEDSQNLCIWLNECPEEIILKYPSAINSCILEMFTIYNIPELMRMKELLLKSLELNTILTKEERNNLLGDAEVSESFLFYNDISAMSDYHRRANHLLSRTSFSIDQNSPWTFASPSIFMMYHRNIGGADEENEEMKECMPYYYKISDEHGNGAEYVFQAELFYERGQIIDADISNRIAMAHAKRRNQYSIMLSSKILSMRMAILNGNWNEIDNCSMDCREWLLNEKQYTLINTLDISQGFIYSLLEHIEALPKWILEGRLSEAFIMFPAQPMIHTYYNQLLLARHQWTEVIARHEECEEIYGVFNNIMCQIWLYIQQAAALNKLNRFREAIDNLKIALDMAIPDRIIMPFVESESYIENILIELRKKGIYIEAIDSILSLSEEFRKGKQKILWEHWSEHEDYGLSQRELEIAKLAAMRKTNLEIAEELHLAEGTVRNQLSRVFDKLDMVGSGKNKRTRLENLLKIKK